MKVLVNGQTALAEREQELDVARAELQGLTADALEVCDALLPPPPTEEEHDLVGWVHSLVVHRPMSRQEHGPPGGLHGPDPSEASAPRG